VVRKVGSAENQNRISRRKLRRNAAFTKSGRQDLNLRPLGPESDSECSAGLAPGGTEAQALDIIGSVERANPSDGIGATPDQRRYVPPVSPRHAELPEHLLTVREVAEHLGVCAATVYKLCATGELLHLRISNAVRIAPADLAEYIARRRGLSFLGDKSDKVTEIPREQRRDPH